MSHYGSQISLLTILCAIPGFINLICQPDDDPHRVKTCRWMSCFLKLFDGYLSIPYSYYTSASLAVLLDCTLPCLQWWFHHQRNLLNPHHETDSSLYSHYRNDSSASALRVVAETRNMHETRYRENSSSHDRGGSSGDKHHQQQWLISHISLTTTETA